MIVLSAVLTLVAVVTLPVGFLTASGPLVWIALASAVVATALAAVAIARRAPTAGPDGPDGAPAV